jgi:hypothetical protein
MKTEISLPDLIHGEEDSSLKPALVALQAAALSRNDW